jgi:hypothetical protein
MRSLDLFSSTCLAKAPWHPCNFVIIYGLSR